MKLFPQNSLVSSQYSYFESGRIILIQDFDADSILKFKQQFFYDSIGNLIEIRKSNYLTNPPNIFSSYFSKEINDSLSIEKNWDDDFSDFTVEKRLVNSPYFLIEKSDYIAEKIISNTSIYKYEGYLLKEIKEFNYSNAKVETLDQNNKVLSRYTQLTYETRKKH